MHASSSTRTAGRPRINSPNYKTLGDKKVRARPRRDTRRRDAGEGQGQGQGQGGRQRNARSREGTLQQGGLHRRHAIL